MHKKPTIYALLYLLLSPLLGVTSTNNFQKPFYAGISAGFGSTTWVGLVPSMAKQNSAMSISVPTEVNEGGAIWGVFTGYEFTPYFAIEANYRRYPRATIIFDKESLFAYENDDKVSFSSETESIDLMAKVMLIIPKTTLRLFSSMGISNVHRKDETKDFSKTSPTFSGGFNYSFTKNLVAELGFNYTAGYGESELSPTNDYLPFLYSGFISLAYRF